MVKDVSLPVAKLIKSRKHKDPRIQEPEKVMEVRKVLRESMKIRHISAYNYGFKKTNEQQI